MSLFACVAALVARRTGRAAKLRLDRDDDMRSTGKRHAFQYAWDVGFDDEGRILGLDLTLASRCGFSADLSGPVNDRAVFHADNAYWLPNVALHSYRCKTHTVSDTAFRGFGGPQGMFAIEMVIDEIARALGRDPLDVRRVNFYGKTTNNVAPYGMVIEDNIAPELVARTRGDVALPRAAAGDRRVEPRQSGDQARPGADTRQVRHFVHRHALQPGRRAAAPLQRRHAAAESWRHGNGPGPLHQGAAGRRAGAGRADGGDPRIGLRHEQGAQRVADRGLVRQRHQRHGRAQRRAHAARAARRLRRAQVRLRRGDRRVPRRRRPRRAQGRCLSPNWRAWRTSRACSCPPPAFTRRPRSTTTARRCRAAHSSTSPTARRSRKWRSTRSPASTGCSRWTSCTTSASRSIPPSIADRSRAASCRAGAGWRWRNCGGTRRAN